MVSNDSVLKDPASVVAPGKQALDAALDRTMRNGMPPILWALAFVYAITTIGHIVSLTGGMCVAQVTVGIILVLACMATGHVTYRKIVSPRVAHLLGACLAAGVLGEIFLFLKLDREPVHSFYISLFLIGVGVFLLSRFYVALLMGAGIVGWAIIALTGESPSQWLDFSYFHVVATGIGVAFFAVRRKNCLDIEKLTWAQNQRSEELQRLLDEVASTEARFSLEFVVTSAHLIK